jgi:hypothetical protein
MHHSHWDEINPHIPCPINFTDEDIHAHLRDGEGWNEIADLWDALEEFAHRDGWTLTEDYEQVREMFAQLREKGLEEMSGEERVAFEEVTRWAVRNREEVGGV